MQFDLKTGVAYWRTGLVAPESKGIVREIARTGGDDALWAAIASRRRIVRWGALCRFGCRERAVGRRGEGRGRFRRKGL